MGEDRWLVATLSEDAPRLAADRGLDLEIDAFCTAENMDGEAFERWDRVVRGQLALAPGGVLHAPFAELFPCAIDPQARQLAARRLGRAAEIARGYGIDRMVVHSGYLPRVYLPEWFESRSAEFWKEFLAAQSTGFEVLVENVLDDDPASLARMLDAVGDSRLRACLDVGHANVASRVPVVEWVNVLGGRVGHVHLHNNHGVIDEHNPPDCGDIDVCAVLSALDLRAPGATITLECPNAVGAVTWLADYVKTRTRV